MGLPCAHPISSLAKLCFSSSDVADITQHLPQDAAKFLATVISQSTLKHVYHTRKSGSKTHFIHHPTPKLHFVCIGIAIVHHSRELLRASLVLDAKGFARLVRTVRLIHEVRLDNKGAFFLIDTPNRTSNGVGRLIMIEHVSFPWDHQMIEGTKFVDEFDRVITGERGVHHFNIG